MSIFSSKTVISVDVVTQQLVDEKQNFIKQGVLSGTLSGNGPAAGLKNQIENGLSANVDKYFRFGRRSEYIGLPTGNIIKDNIGLDEAKTQTEAILGLPVTIDKAYISTPASDLFAAYFLQENYGIDHTTLILDTLINPTLGGTQALVSGEFLAGSQLIITYEVRLPSGNTLHTTTVNLPVNQDKLFLYSYYYLVSNPNELKLLIEETNKASDTTEQDIEYFPILPIKKEQVSILDSASEEEIRAYEKACEGLGFSFTEMVEDILKPNPDNDPNQMNDVFFQFAADIHSKDPYTNLYLFEYFDSLRGEQVMDKAEYLAWLETAGVPELFLLPRNNVVQVKQGNYNSALVFNYIEAIVENDTENLKLNEVKKSFVVRPPIEPPAILSIGGFNNKFLEQSEMILVKKVNETQVIKLTIHGLTHIHNVYQNNVAIRTIENSLDEANTRDDEKSFFIPLSYKIVKKMSPLKRNFLYQDTMTVTVYAVSKTKVKWYQRGIFRIILTIAAIVYFYFTGDYSTAAAVITAVAKLVLTLIVVRLIIKPILIKIVEILGLETSGIIAIILAVAAVISGDMATASELLRMAQWTLEAVAEVSQNIIENLQEELAKLFDSFKDFQDEMDEINDALGKRDNDYLLKNYLGFYFDPNETPDMFFYRTIHETNPGTLIFDFVENYYTNKLELPKVKHEFSMTHQGGI